MAYYIEDRILLPEDIPYLADLSYYDGRFYFFANNEGYGDETPVYTSSAAIYSINTDGSEFTQITGGSFPFEKPEDMYENTKIFAMTIDDEGNIWVCVSGAYFKLNLPDYFDPQSDGLKKDDLYQYQEYGEFIDAIIKLDREGNLLSTIYLDHNFLADSRLFQYPRKITVQGSPGKKYIYLGSDQPRIVIDNGEWREEGEGLFKTCVIDTEGNILFTGSLQSKYPDFSRLPDGTSVLADDMGILYKIDLAAGSFIKITETPLINLLPVENEKIKTELRFLATSSNGRSDILISSYERLYSFRMEDGAIETVLDWSRYGIMPELVQSIIMLPDGRIACYAYSIDSFSFCIIIFSNEIKPDSTPSSADTGVQEITLAGVGIEPDIIRAVAAFNAVNKDCRIIINDYLQSDYLSAISGTAPTLADDIKRLNTDIISGNAPDILYTNNIPFFDYAGAGFLIDLYPLIDADPELDRSDFLQAPLQASEYGGRLYRAFSRFDIVTIIGSSSVLGPDNGWDIDEFEKILLAHPEADIPIGDTFDGTRFLRNGAIQAVIDEHIDKEAGTADFDSAGFIMYLELVKRLFENVKPGQQGGFTDTVEAILSGRQIMTRSLMAGFGRSQNEIAVFGPDIVMKGFPNSGRNGHVYMNFYNSLAIINSSPNIDIAWSFVRTILDKQWQIDNGVVLFALNKEAFFQNAEYALDNSVDYKINGITYPALTKADIDKIVALVNSTHNSCNFDSALLDIICEGADDYFNGMRNAEDAARIIQSKVSIFLAERDHRYYNKQFN